MTGTPWPVELNKLRVIVVALIFAALVALGTAVALVTSVLETGARLHVVAYVLSGIALLTPGVAAFVRSMLLASRPPSATPVAGRWFAAQLVYFAILESAVYMCVAATIVTRLVWPAGLAIVPLGMMVAQFPRE